MNIFISTNAFPNKSISDIIATAMSLNTGIEFSSDLPYLNNMTNLYLSAPIKKIIHNYFPAPESSFVLNMASDDINIRQRSVEHCKQGLKLAHLSGGPFYSAHAGFCIDPSPEELGRHFNLRQDFNRNLHWENYLMSVSEVLDYAEKLGTDFLIENNVILNSNMNKIDICPLLCVHPDELVRLIREFNNPRLGLLLDTGHLKVSGNTLGFNYEEKIIFMHPYIRGIHHSDNDGRSDTNGRLSYSYWFLKFMHFFSDVVHVVEVRDLSASEMKHHMNLLESSTTNSESMLKLY